MTWVPGTERSPWLLWSFVQPHGTWGACSVHRSVHLPAIVPNYSLEIKVQFTKKYMYWEVHVQLSLPSLDGSPKGENAAVYNKKTCESTCIFLHLWKKVQECKFPKTFVNFIMLQILPSFKILIPTGSWSSKKPCRNLSLCRITLLCARSFRASWDLSVCLNAVLQRNEDLRTQKSKHI